MIIRKNFLLVISILLIIVFSLSSCTPRDSKYPRAGRDTVKRVCEGKYEIGKNHPSLNLYMHSETGWNYSIMSDVYDYKKINGKFYVYGREWYCVIDIKTKLCIICITVEEQTVSNTPKNDPFVTYIKSYDDFTENHKKAFEELMK